MGAHPLDDVDDPVVPVTGFPIGQGSEFRPEVGDRKPHRVVCVVAGHAAHEMRCSCHLGLLIVALCTCGRH